MKQQIYAAGGRRARAKEEQPGVDGNLSAEQYALAHKAQIWERSQAAFAV